MTRRVLPILATVAALIAFTGCDDDARSELLDDATETLLRNFAATQGAEQFNHEGFEIDDDGLTCTAAVGDGGLESIDLECTGTTVDGGEARLSGTTSEFPGASITELKGRFTATVDGEEIFETDQLGG